MRPILHPSESPEQRCGPEGPEGRPVGGRPRRREPSVDRCAVARVPEDWTHMKKMVERHLALIGISFGQTESMAHYLVKRHPVCFAIVG